MTALMTELSGHPKSARHGRSRSGCGHVLVQIQRVVHLATASLNSLFGFEEHARRCIRGLFGGSLTMYGDGENMQSGGQWERVFPARLSIEVGSGSDVGALGERRRATREFLQPRSPGDGMRYFL